MCKTTADPGAQQQQGTLLASVRLGRRGPLRSEGGSWSAGTQPVPGESSLRTAQGGAAPGAVHGADPAELHQPLGRGLGQPQPDPAVPAAGPESALRPGLPLDSPWTAVLAPCRRLHMGKRRCSPSVCHLETGSCAVPTCSLSANLHRTAETVSPAGFLRPAPEARHSALGWPVTCFAATRTHPLPAASHPLCFLTSCSWTNCCSRQLQMIGWEEKGARRHGEPGACPWVWVLRWPCHGDWEWI